MGMHTGDEPAGSLWRLAVHEIGHGLIYIVHGGTVTSLAARPWVQVGGGDGCCEGKLADGVRSLGAHQVHGALAALAGRAAERQFFGWADVAGCTADLQDFAARVQKVDAAWHTGAPVAAWEKALGETAREVIAAHEPVIAYVARVLADEWSMGERRAMELFGVARKLWELQPGPLADPFWRVRIEAAVKRYQIT
jgi:hypothetical protein